MCTTSDPKDRDAWEKELKTWAKDYPKEATRVAGELEVILRQFNTFDVLAHVSYENLFFIADSYEEPLHEGKSAFVEYVTLLALKGEFVEEGERALVPEDVKQIQALVEEAFAMEGKFRMAGLLQRRGAVDPFLEDVRSASQLHELMVRAMVYPIHLSEVLIGLFTPFDADLKRLVGFTTRSATQLPQALNALVSDRMQGRLANARTGRQELLKKVRARKRDSSVDINLPEALVKHLLQLPDKKIRLLFRKMAAHWALNDLGKTTSFIARDLSEQMNAPVEEIVSLLGYLAVDFGSIDSDFCIPRGDHILKKKPLIHHGGRYQLPSEPLLRDAMVPAMENILTSSPRLKDRYRRARHDFLLTKGIECIQTLLPGASVDTNLYYDFKGDRCELDALIRYDKILFLLEAKGAPLSPAAKRGAPTSLKSSLRRIVTHAFRQGFRAHSFLQGDSGKFEREDGSGLDLSPEDFHEIFTVSLHLEQIGHLTSLASSVEVLDLPIDNPEQYWMVSLYDLMVMSDIIEIPSMFPQYLKRRLRVSRQRLLEAPEELDFFCYYLKTGLYFDSQEFGEVDSVNLMSQTVPLDNYYFTVQGQRRQPADKPRQKMSSTFESLVRAVEASGLPGRTSVNMALLDHGGKSREGFCSEVLKARKRFAGDGKLHDCSTYFKVGGGWGLTFICGPEEEATDALLWYCAAKKKEKDATAWYGIADCGQDSPRICDLIVAS